MSVLTQNENLISCPDCSGSVSRRAVGCPHCGAPFVDIPAHQDTGLQVAERPASAAVPRPEDSVQRKIGPQWLVLVIAAVMVALTIVGPQSSGWSPWSEVPTAYDVSLRSGLGGSVPGPRSTTSPQE